MFWILNSEHITEMSCLLCQDLSVWFVSCPAVGDYPAPRAVLTGHDHEVVCVSVCAELGLVISGAKGQYKHHFLPFCVKKIIYIFKCINKYILLVVYLLICLRERAKQLQHSITITGSHAVIYYITEVTSNRTIPSLVP